MRIRLESFQFSMIRKRQVFQLFCSMVQAITLFDPTQQCKFWNISKGNNKQIQWQVKHKTKQNF